MLTLSGYVASEPCLETLAFVLEVRRLDGVGDRWIIRPRTPDAKDAVRALSAGERVYVSGRPAQVTRTDPARTSRDLEIDGHVVVAIDPNALLRVDLTSPKNRK